MRGAATVIGQIVGAGVLIAAIGGLIGLIIVESATSRSAWLGVGWDMTIAGALVGLLALAGGIAVFALFGH